MQLQQRQYPSLIKYMGSKTKLMQFVLDGLNECDVDQQLVDLFSGSASLAGAVGNQVSILSNDIQAYSKVLADTYTIAYQSPGTPTADELIQAAKSHQLDLLGHIGFEINYKQSFSVSQLAKLEKVQQSLIDTPFSVDWHFFTKTYSGTWWSADQTSAIDALRKAAETFKDAPVYPAILSAIMYAMAYSSIGTGHYAQFRDPKTESNVKDILIYRSKDTFEIFKRKYTQLLEWLPISAPTLSHRSVQADYSECLSSANDGSTVYADPPYCFVHYSRFYHALETLVLYDNPSIQVKGGKLVKGRYRENRHQSPFSIASKVASAFEEMFERVRSKDMSLVLSYSNTGMISLEDILDLATKHLPKNHIEIVTTDYKHMTLGRQFDRSRDVKECLLIAK